MASSEVDFIHSNDEFNQSDPVRNLTGFKQLPINVPIGSPVVQVFCAVAVPVIIVFGLCGNVMSFVILKDSAHRLSSHFYLCCLAVMDSLTLLSIMTSIWLGVIMQGFYYLFGQYVEGNWVVYLTSICPFTQFRVYFSFFCRMISIWTIVILTVERCITVLSPLKWGTRLCTVRNGIIAIACLTVTSALLNIYVIIGFEERSIRGKIKCVPNQHFFIGRVAGNLVLSVVPWLIICVANLLLVVTLRRRNRQSGGSYQRQENNVTFRLLVISIAFLCFTLPITIMTTIHTGHELSNSSEHKDGPLADFWLIGFVIFTMNFAFNFLLYCLTGKNFRKAAWALITCNINRMSSLRQRLDRSASQGDSSKQPVNRSDSGNSRTNVTMLSRDSSSARQSSNASDNARLLAPPMRRLRKETQI